jgi:hypothetical protein
MLRFGRLFVPRPLLAIAILCLLGSSPAFAHDQSSGEVTKIDTSKKSLVIAAECSCGSGKLIEMSFKLKDDTKVLLNGKEAKLADLKNGDQVDVDYEAVDDVQKVSATREG